jgi:ribosomal protein S18 acetylase RimI-like enzyme
MRGQRLFVRAIEASDHDLVRTFLVKEGRRNVPACGLLGKLVGELVAVVAMQITPDTVRIDDIVVKRELRRKRIGRVMLDELEQIAIRIERQRLIVEDSVKDAAGFLERIGFRREGAQWIRNIPQ